MKKIFKSEEAFKTIGEVSQLLDLPQHVLRFWESKFTQIKPLKRAGGRRYYRPEDVVLLKRIYQLIYKDGLTIKGVKKILREKGTKSILFGSGDILLEVSNSAYNADNLLDSANNTDNLRGELVKMRDLLKSVIK